MKRSFESLSVDGEAIYQRTFAGALAQRFTHWYSKQQCSNERRCNQAVRDARYEAEQLIEGSFMKFFRQTPEHRIAENLNKPTHCDRDSHERDGAVPNFRPSGNMRSQPAGERLIETQAGDKNEGPTQQIEYAQNEPASPAVEHTQKHQHDEHNIDCVEGHEQ